VRVSHLVLVGNGQVNQRRRAKNTVRRKAECPVGLRSGCSVKAAVPERTPREEEKPTQKGPMWETSNKSKRLCALTKKGKDRKKEERY